MDCGARFIVCFFDENSLDDKKRGPSHEYCAQDYHFLLDEFIRDPELGLIFKPKQPSTMRRRFGQLVDRIEAAIASGRCIYIGEGVEEGISVPSMLPCEVSGAADMTIGILHGSTAATESVLAGGRALLLDREGYFSHPMCHTKGTITFLDWHSLWEALSGFRKFPDAFSKVGDWSRLLPEIDSFRDGRASQRMGNYIGWLAESISNGDSRDEAMLKAKSRFESLWGVGTVIEAGSPIGRPVPSHTIAIGA